MPPSFYASAPTCRGVCCNYCQEYRLFGTSSPHPDPSSDVFARSKVGTCTSASFSPCTDLAGFHRNLEDNKCRHISSVIIIFLLDNTRGHDEKHRREREKLGFMRDKSLKINYVSFTHIVNGLLYALYASFFNASAPPRYLLSHAHQSQAQHGTTSGACPTSRSVKAHIFRISENSKTLKHNNLITYQVRKHTLSKNTHRR